MNTAILAATAYVTGLALGYALMTLIESRL